MNDLLIVGAGGHGKVVADAALCSQLWRWVLATDCNVERCTGELLAGVPLCTADDAQLAHAKVHVAIGNNTARQRELLRFGLVRAVSVVHPKASVSAYAVVGVGCFIASHSVLSASSQLGLGVIVNHGAIVDHDVQIDDFSHIAPNVSLGGAVRIGKRVLLGSGSVVLPGLSVADDVVVGAGAVVQRSILEPGIYVGVPARKIQ